MTQERRLCWPQSNAAASSPTSCCCCCCCGGSSCSGACALQATTGRLLRELLLLLLPVVLLLAVAVRHAASARLLPEVPNCLVVLGGRRLAALHLQLQTRAFVVARPPRAASLDAAGPAHIAAALELLSYTCMLMIAVRIKPILIVSTL
jgi:hypothetical protein